jgi:hypothetical protein
MADIVPAYDAHKQSVFFAGPRPIYQAIMDLSYPDRQQMIDRSVPCICPDLAGKRGGRPGDRGAGKTLDLHKSCRAKW